LVVEFLNNRKKVEKKKKSPKEDDVLLCLYLTVNRMNACSLNLDSVFFSISTPNPKKKLFKSESMYETSSSEQSGNESSVNDESFTPSGDEHSNPYEADDENEDEPKPKPFTELDKLANAYHIFLKSTKAVV